MSDAAKQAKSQVDRRTVVRGAAWSVPVVAMATAVPAAASSTGRVGLDIDAGCISVVGVEVLPGFSIKNAGTLPFTGTINAVETIDLSSVEALVRVAFWTALGVTSLLPTRSAGVTVTGWATSGDTPRIPARRQRTIAYGPRLAAGAQIGWGQVVSLAGVGDLVGGSWSAELVAPTGADVVDAGPSELNFSLLGTC